MKLPMEDTGAPASSFGHGHDAPAAASSSGARTHGQLPVPEESDPLGPASYERVADEPLPDEPASDATRRGAGRSHANEALAARATHDGQLLAMPARVEQITRFSHAGTVSHTDEVAVEEPLAIRIAGETLAITMRTPGHDTELAVGFLWAEGIITSLHQVGSIIPCAGAEGAIDVVPAEGHTLKLDGVAGGKRGTLTTSACGVCGRRTVQDLLARCGRVASGQTIRAAAVARSVDALRATQPLFTRTGGCHGAALVTLDGEHVATFEDVGRHNAVDKLVGSRVLAGMLPASAHALVVSGRTSFELVQKAAVAGIPIVIGISAASSLAIETARGAGITLIGFARGGQFVTYTGAERVLA